MSQLVLIRKKEEENNYEKLEQVHTFRWTVRRHFPGASMRMISPLGVFVCCKMFSGKYIFSGNANFQKRKMYSGYLAVSEIVLWKINSGVWFVQTFFGNRFTENQFWCLVRPNIFYGKCFTENQFPCLVWSNILRKMKFVFLRKLNFGVWFVDHFTENMKCVTNWSTCII